MCEREEHKEREPAERMNDNQQQTDSIGKPLELPAVLQCAFE
jgi:hypothetical protein